MKRSFDLTASAAGLLAPALFLVYALGVSNFGTAIRHRAKMAPILLILAAGLPYLRRRRRLDRKLRIARANPLVVRRIRRMSRSRFTWAGGSGRATSG